MKTIQPIPPGAFDHYGPLMERYARRLIKDATVAAVLSKHVLTDQYYMGGLVPSASLRKLLKFDLYNRCNYLRLSRVFDRAPEKLPPVSKTPNLFQTDKLKNQTP